MDHLSTHLQIWDQNVKLLCVSHPFPEQLHKLIMELSLISKPPMAFQSSIIPTLKRNRWFVLQRPKDKSVSGFLIEWNSQWIFVEMCKSHKKQKYRGTIFPIRVDPELLGHGLTVFVATLSLTLKQLWIEDLIYWKGDLSKEFFTQRMSKVQRWISSSYLDHNQFAIILAPWSSLNTLNPEGIWLIQNNDIPNRKWVLNFTEAAGSKEPSSAGSKEPSSAGSKEPSSAGSKEPKLSPEQFVCLAEKGILPEQWNLFTKSGKSLGNGLIRTLVVSDIMRPHKTPQHVIVQWNKTFQKWEIQNITDLPCTHEVSRV